MMELYTEYSGQSKSLVNFQYGSWILPFFVIAEGKLKEAMLLSLHLIHCIALAT
jgi:hypothetical protein